MNRLLLRFILSGLLLSSAVPAQNNKAEASGTLRQYADKIGFRIGTGLRPKSWDRNPDGQRILAEQFNSTIAMGMMGVNEPEQGRFDFSRMDRMIEFAGQHNMKIWGAALIYRPDSLPPWMHQKMRGGPRHSFSNSELESILKNHIQTVVRHGGDAFYAWGVVNEPLSHRNNPWEIILGRDEYIASAFRYARQATQADLVLNDTFGQKCIDKNRADEFFGIVKRMKAQNVPIDAVGTEMHLELQQLDPDYLNQFRDFLRRARELGVKVYVTEMDVYQGHPGQVENAWEMQRKVYHDVTAACLADSNCKGLTVWDLSDKDTWLVNKKQEDLHDAKPDLFDDDMQKKPAYYGVLDALKEAARH
jgi:endo-1,4-beta-xylanase